MMYIIMIAVILGIYFYTFMRLWQMIPAGGVWRGVFVVFAVLSLGSFFVSMLASNAMPIPLVSALYKLGTSWFFITIYLLMIFLVLDLLRLTPLPIMQYTRESWLGLGVLAATVTVIMTAGYINYLNKERIELPLAIEKTISGNGLKIVAISDLHLGYGISERELGKWVELINAENPDIVLIAGDIIDNSVRPLNEGRHAEIFRSIRSRYGVYACTGNHEHISDIQSCVSFLEKTGIHILRDSAVLVDSAFYIVGREDMTNLRRAPLDQLTAPLDKSKPIIVLDHQPHDLSRAEKANVDLQISGHTHRGQVWPITWITDGMFELSHGHKQKSNTHYFVSAGIGIWGGKFRIGSRSDYAVITLSGPDK